MSSGDAAFLISAGGISNTIGRQVQSCAVTHSNVSHLRLVGGWLSDQHWTHPLIITLVALIAGVVPSFVLPWYEFVCSFSLVSLLLQVLCLLDLPYFLWVLWTCYRVCGWLHKPSSDKVVGSQLLVPGIRHCLGPAWSCCYGWTSFCWTPG